MLKGDKQKIGFCLLAFMKGMEGKKMTTLFFLSQTDFQIFCIYKYTKETFSDS